MHARNIKVEGNFPDLRLPFFFLVQSFKLTEARLFAGLTVGIQ